MRRDGRSSSAGFAGATVPGGASEGGQPSPPSLLGVVDAGVEPGIEQVDGEVDDQEDQRHQEDQGLHGRIVTLADGLDQRRPHPGNHEDDNPDGPAPAEAPSMMATRH